MTMICQECQGTGRVHRPGCYAEHVCHVCNGAGSFDIPPIAVEDIVSGAVISDFYRPAMQGRNIVYIRACNWPSQRDMVPGRVVNPVVDLRETLVPVNSFCREDLLGPNFEDIDQEWDEHEAG